MFNRVSSLVLAILLFVVFYGSTSSLNVFAVGLVLFIAATVVINAKRLGMRFAHLALPVFYLSGVASIFMVLPSATLRTIFLVAGCLVFYAVEMELGRESHFLQNVYLFSVFAIFTGMFAIGFYFHIHYVWMAVAFFAVTYALIIQGFAGFQLPVKKYFSLLIAFVSAQAAWGLSLWPTHYLVNSIVAFSIFYLLWIFSFSAFFGRLTRTKIYWQLSFIFIILAITLGTASFKPFTR